MAKTLAQVQKQIAQLQKEASSIKARELSGVIGRIKEAVAHYDLTASDIFGGGTRSGGVRKTRRNAKATAGKKAPLPPKYGDGTGNTWSGHGKRPNWFKNALSAGKTAEDMLVK
jgi:DNA-binding protein H-NS